MRDLKANELGFVSGGRGGGGAGGDRGAGDSRGNKNSHGNPGTSASNKNRARPQSN